jgi:hypothetical protein
MKELNGLVLSVVGIGFIVLLIIATMFAWPQYNIYAQRAQGQAMLAHAQSSKEVAVAEARAKMESAELLAQAEVARAKGVAQANAIIGESLKGNEAYLRYLWITDVAAAGTEKQVVYIPTEANMPILEAARLK